MTNLRSSPSSIQRASHVDEVLRAWANAIGCSANQVTEVARRAGLPIEKLWHSIDRASRIQPTSAGSETPRRRGPSREPRCS